VRLILVRHGHAHAGFHGAIGGPKGCTGLTDLGRHQAARLRDHLAASERVRADVLLASVIPRAIETAEIIAPALGFDAVAQDCDLCEVHTGEADGLDWAEWGRRYGSFAMEAEPDRLFAPGGESWNSWGVGHPRAAHQHRPHRVGVGAGARPLDAAHLQRDRPPVPVGGGRT
jgi:broad specificity phosphatase PhoE